MKPELKPCPFCGEKDNLFVQYCEGTVVHPAYRVYCDNCGASTGYVDNDNHVDNWNRRAPAEPVNVPSDIELDDLADGFHGYAGNYTRHGYPIPKFNHIGYAHALLSKYADPHPQQQSKGEPVKVTVDAAAVLRFAAQTVELYDDATMRDNYMIDSSECAEILLALADYFSRFSAPQPQQTSDEWKQTIDHELVSFGSTADSYSSPKEAINALIEWNVSVATDPKVNGGYMLVPIEPTDEMIEAADQGDRIYTNRCFGKDMRTVMQGPYDHYKAMLKAASEVRENP